MRHRFYLLFIAVVCAFLLVPLIAVNAQAGVTVTAQVQASLREGPSRQTRVLGGMPENASAPALARSQDNTWVQVTYNGVTGWVAVRQLTVNGDINTLPVSAASGGAVAPSGTTPVKPANTRTLTLTERRVYRWLASVDSDVSSATIQNGQLVVVVKGKVDGADKVLTEYFNVTVADGKLAVAMTTLSFDGGNHPSTDFVADGINKANARIGDALNGLFKAWVGTRTIVSVTLVPGQLVIDYAR